MQYGRSCRAYPLTFTEGLQLLSDPAGRVEVRKKPNSAKAGKRAPRALMSRQTGQYMTAGKRTLAVATTEPVETAREKRPYSP